MYGIGAIGVWKLVPYPMDPEENGAPPRSLREKLSGFDYGGIILATGGLTIFTFAITQANSLTNGWRSPTIISLLVLGVAFITAFCFYETYIPKNPLMPMSIWKYPGVALCMLISSCGWMAFNGITTYYCPLYFLKVVRVSPILATAYLTPYSIFGISVNIFAAFTLHRIPGRYLLIAGNLGYLGTSLIWALIPLGSNYWALPFPSMFLGVIGSDLAYNVGNIHILRSVSSKLQSSAAGMFNTNLQLSITVGLAASSAVVSTIVQNQDSASPELLLKGYHAGAWLAVGMSAVGLLMTPFLRIGLQGIDEKLPHDEV
ncbi:hypothetical protein AWJ20_832 [Sugiyamaella lignohabitans]|uniref:Uncharacterized protein n=1 Tax=Sugiyamaella lignohabitans TaxID=796027 RepID=A0A167D7H3_9ASCO|nr:uncharacterized protein AWJ20_832 [Sugiyamaella lignohabitans]ANB12575.1 hypothetical protein AWJ20_832 [Sugiyamaella lignohabitans]